MSIQQNKELVLSFYQEFDNRNIEQALTMLSSNFIAHLGGVTQPLDRSSFEQFSLEFYLAFTEGRHIFEQVIVEGDKVVTCGVFIGKHLGNFQGIAATGKEIKLAVMHIDRLEAGQIVEHWGQGDALGLMQQLGIIFLPSPGVLINNLKTEVPRPNELKCI